MKRIIYLSEGFQACAEDGRLVELLPAPAETAAGRILWGRVDRMMPGLEAAFVDIGRKKDGFLPLKENSDSFTEAPFRSGDRVLVQIRREETGNKGALLSRDISLPGSYVLLMPRNRHIGISARVKEPETRDRLRALGQEIAGDRFGLVMRETAAFSNGETVKAEAEGLWQEWQEILRGDLTPSEEPELIRDYGPRGIDQVVRLEGDDPAECLPADLNRQRKEAENRQIRLPQGGNIVIDRCEALTVIDVNSGSDPGDGSRRETALRTNLEACREIMIQTRLRNLGGILIVDFIDMDAEADRERVRKELEICFREDRIKTVIHGYTSLGLMEMTRKRSGKAWEKGQNT